MIVFQKQQQHEALTEEEFAEIAHRIMNSRKLKDDSDLQNIELFAYSVIPALTFMGLEMLAHGIFPSHIGQELISILKDILETIGRRKF